MGDPEKEITTEDVLSPVSLQPNAGVNDVDKSFAVIGGQKRRNDVFCSASEDGACSSYDSLEIATSSSSKRKKTNQNPATSPSYEPSIAENHDEPSQSVSILDHKADPSPSPFGDINPEWLLSKLEELQDHLDEALQKLMDEMGGDGSLCMHQRRTLADIAKVLQSDLHTTKNQCNFQNPSNSPIDLDRQCSESIPARPSGPSISPPHSAATTPQASSDYSPVSKLIQRIESEEASSERLLSPKFRRVDRHWDASEQKFVKTEPAAEPGHHEAAQAENYIFVVRRDLNCDKTHIKTTVEIKDSLFRECLRNVMGNSSGVNFTEENPVLDPKTLFLYWDDFKSHHKSLAQAGFDNITGYWPRKKQDEISFKSRCLGTLIEYLEQEFAEDKKNLGSMLSKGVITFDLLWALWKPSTLIFSPTYRGHDVPSVSVLRYTENRKNQCSTDSKCSVNTVYIDSDGKTFSYKALKRDVQHFNGAVSITSLPFYPLQYHKDEAQIRRLLVERGAKFVSLRGIHHKSFTGLAFPLVQGKIETMAGFREGQSRIMVDPVGFRNVFPEAFKTKDLPMRYTNEGEIFNDGVQLQSLMGMLPTCTETADDDQHNLGNGMGTNNDSPSRNCEGKALEMSKDNLLLLCSPVVAGYSLASLEWLEFDVRGIENVKWDEEAWHSLVLNEKMRELIKATVTSRILNSAFSINNKVPTKTKGLTIVLHGPPGTGKTLTVTGLSDHLRRPLLMLPARELMGCCAVSVDSALDRLLTTCQSWNAIVALDDAQILLEKYDCLGEERKNLVATVSRRLESFQGVIFLTCDTIRVFEEAYQSRIDFVQKYDKPDRKGKRIILERAIRRVMALGLWKTEAFSDEDYGKLVVKDFSGREIEKTVELALSLAEARQEALGVRHLQDVMDMQERFRCDFGGRDCRNYFS